MRKLILIILILPFLACKNTADEPAKTENKKVAAVEKNYPSDLSNVFKTHGGLEAWKSLRTLTFVLPKPENPETHTIDLWSRNERIETDNYTLGFDGKPWVMDNVGDYKGNPEFYHNLMFYFYTMPFVLGDEGIVYGKTKDLVYDGIAYPGIEISYNAGVGTSPKDNYYIHYDAETNQMAWLGYTVTYRSGEKSDDVRWIRYDDWKKIGELVLPNSISWHTVEDGEIKGVRNQVFFENVEISKEPKQKTFYGKPETGKYWKKPKSE